MLRKNKNFDFTVLPREESYESSGLLKFDATWETFAVIENTRVYSKHFCDEDYTVCEDG